MTYFEHDPQILEQADFLAVLQKDGQQVMINMRTDEDTQTASHYYGMVERVVTEVPKPYIDIKVEKLVIEYFSLSHRDASALFDTLRAAREAVIKDPGIESTINNDLSLMDAIEHALGVVEDKQTIELNGMPQRIAISGIRMTFGLGRP